MFDKENGVSHPLVFDPLGLPVEIQDYFSLIAVQGIPQNVTL